MIALVLRHIAAECVMVAGKAELQALIRKDPPRALLADLDRYERAPEWGRDGGHVPCIGLTRRTEAKAKLDAFGRGASDVIQIPFTPDEIVVRTMAAIARAHGQSPRLRPRVTVGPFELDLPEGRVRLDSTELRLTPLEQTLLYLFIAHPGEVLTREEILVNVWGEGTAVTSNVIDRHIRDLRIKLSERWRTPRFLETVAGEGYRYIGDGAS